MNEYKKMVIVDVNNYLSIDKYDNIKSKGRFETYEDIIKQGAYHKDTSASIIAQALQEFYLKGIPIEETINNHNNIYDFCLGVNGSKKYDWVISEFNGKVITNQRFNQRFVRYYIGGKQSLSKEWISGSRKGSFELVEANTLITIAQIIAKDEINSYTKRDNKLIMARYTNLDRQYYIDKCYEVINSINKFEVI